MKKRLTWRERAERARQLTPEMAAITVGARVVRRGTTGPGGTVVAIHQPFEVYANQWKPWSATVAWPALRRLGGCGTQRSRLALTSLQLAGR